MSRWPSTGTAALIFFGISFLFFLPAFLPGRHIFGTDYLAGGYPFYHFISERFASGALPKWVPYVFGGMPLFANPGSTYYPIHVLADLIFPFSRVFPTVFWFQFGIAGLGMYLLTVELGCRRWVGLVAGLAFQFTGITISWVYAGHDGRIIVATLAPLLFYFLHGGVRTLRLPWFVGAATTLAFALLSFQIQNSYYLLLAAGIWGVYLLLHFRRGRKPGSLALGAGLGVGAVAVGFLLASVNFLPFLDYVAESPRGQEGGRGYEYSISYSMPPAEVLSLAVPEHHGASVGDQEGRPLFPQYRGANPFKLHTEYVGAFVLLFVLLGMYYARGVPHWWVFVGLVVFFLTIALGGNTPLYRLYYELLPGTKRFRAPSLSFFVVAFSLVVLAALALERIAEMRERSAGRRAAAGAGPPLDHVVWIVGAFVGVAFLGAALTAGEAAPGYPAVAQGWGRFGLFGALIGGTVALWVRRQLGTIVAVGLLALFTTADLWTIGRRFMQTVEPPEQMFAPDDVISFLQRQPEPARVWTFPVPSHYRGGGAYGGNYAMLHEVEQVGGEHPNPLQRWNEYVGAGTETYIDWHNLIADARVVDTPEGQAIGFRSVPGFLDGANIRYVVSMAPLVHEGLREVHRGSALVYENERALPRAFLVPEVVGVSGDRMIDRMTSTPWDPRRIAFVAQTDLEELPATPLESTADVLTHEPDRVVIRASANRAALLVLADNFYDGWEARIGEREVPIVRANHTFRGIFLPAGDHQVELVFRPGDLYSGFVIYLIGFAAIAAYAIFLLVSHRRRGSTETAVA